MTEKQFEVTISSDNRVHFTENGIDVISIRFKEYSDAVDCKNALLPFCNRLNNLSEELLIYREIANCSNCKYQNYDWFDDGDEFEICQKGNNEQQIEYHICKDWVEF